MTAPRCENCGWRGPLKPVDFGSTFGVLNCCLECQLQASIRREAALISKASLIHRQSIALAATRDAVRADSARRAKAARKGHRRRGKRR